MTDKIVKTKELIESGKCVLGIEFGSTRIKAVLIDDDFEPIAFGTHSWKNRFENGFYTYHEKDITDGLKSCYSSLKDDVLKKYGVVLKKLYSIGISGMMHGYIVLGSDDKLLVPFRTWRNTNTSEAAVKLSNLFHFNIPERWSLAHLYQAILNGEEHVGNITYMTTLSGYIHYLLTGEKCVGVGEASGMFPINSLTCDYDEYKISLFDELISLKKYNWKLRDILPVSLTAGKCAGHLTDSGALMIDPSGDLEPGIPFCPPEGDAGTGMIATNSIVPGTGNVSAGTSVFGMIVLNFQLSKPYKTVDMVTTPDGKPVAMVHCNNCTSFLNEWIDIFISFAKKIGFENDESEIYELLFNEAEKANQGNEFITYNFMSGEPVLGLSDGVPVMIGSNDGGITVSGFMKSQIDSCVAALACGFDTLHKENIKLDEIFAHGGLFKRGTAGQRALSSALGTKVSVLKTAGEGGPFGMAVLAKYLEKSGEYSLDEYLKKYVFSSTNVFSIEASESEISEFENYKQRFKENMDVEKTALKNSRYGGVENA